MLDYANRPPSSGHAVSANGTLNGSLDEALTCGMNGTLTGSLGYHRSSAFDIHDFDTGYMRAQYERLCVRLEVLSSCFDFIDVQGISNIPKNEPYILFGGHQSHADSAVLFGACLENGVPFPHMVASSTLNHPKILGAFGLDIGRYGTIFVDRAKISRARSNSFSLLRLAGDIEHAVFKRKEGLGVYPIGSGRWAPKIFNPNEDDVEMGFLLPLIDERMRDLNVNVVCAMTGYERRPEDPFLSFIKSLRRNRTIGGFLGGKAYYLADFVAVTTSPFRKFFERLPDFLLERRSRPQGAYLHISESVPLNHLLSKGTRAERKDTLRSHIFETILGLHRQVEEAKSTRVA